MLAAKLDMLASTVGAQEKKFKKDKIRVMV
jgi:hypothetical protein